MALSKQEQTLLKAVREGRVSIVITTPSAPAARTFASKAERKAGNGFTCACGRNDLRVAVTAGKSFHFEPDGVTLHDLR